MNHENSGFRIQNSVKQLWIISFLFIASVFFALTAGMDAHPSRRVKFETLQVFRDRIVLRLRYEISEPRFCTDVRERFDTDASRKLSPDEQESLGRYVWVLATEDLHLHWDGQQLTPSGTLSRTSGLDRELPSAYPLTFYWQIEFLLPASARVRPDAPDRLDHTLVADPRRNSHNRPPVHELVFEDNEKRWTSQFSCTVDLGPGIVEWNSHLGMPVPGETWRSFEFLGGRGSFRIWLLFKSR